MARFVPSNALAVYWDRYEFPFGRVLVWVMTPPFAIPNTGLERAERNADNRAENCWSSRPGASLPAGRRRDSRLSYPRLARFHEKADTAMHCSEAKSLIRMHAGTEDGPKMATGLIGSLRPYRGLDDINFEEIVEAIAAVADHLQAGPDVDRDLIHALWSTCQTARRWGVRESGMLPRNHLISPDDRRKLETWADIIESMTIHLLWGNGLPLAINAYAEAVADARLPAPGTRLVPLFIESLTSDDADVRICTAGALGRMGGAARDAVPALRVCALDSDREVSQMAALSLEKITRAAVDGGEGR